MNLTDTTSRPIDHIAARSDLRTLNQILAHRDDRAWLVGYLGSYVSSAIADQHGLARPNVSSRVWADFEQLRDQLAALLDPEVTS